MKIYKLIDNNSPELILFFGGWATDFNPFARLIAEGKDVVMVYDYTTLDGLHNELNELCSRYTKIHLVAWSMGVWAASKVVELYRLPLCKFASRTAINGTPQAIDPQYGISPKVFDKTIENLPHGLGRFNLRMCGGKRQLDEYNMSPSMRGDDDIKAELIAIRDMSQRVDFVLWDRVIVGTKDTIFTTENQLRFWREYQGESNPKIEIQELSEPHFLFGRYNIWSEIIASTNVNKELIESRFSHAVSSYDRNATAQREICERLFNLVDKEVIAQSPRVLEFGCGTGNLSQLLTTLNPSELLLNDLCSSYKEVLKEKITEANYSFVSGDARELIAELKSQNQRFDIIASASALQWIDRPLQFLSECLELLSPNGILLVSSFAPDNILEVTAITKSGLNYPSLESYRFAFDQKCEILHLSSENITLHFNSPFEVLSHLKYSGVTASKSNRGWTSGDLRKFEGEYNERFRDQDLRCPLTYRPLYLICKN
ncbi:MAG: malonyl-ACP O-methyltransferase BioC [Rikenellaceae bacterium]